MKIAQLLGIQCNLTLKIRASYFSEIVIGGNSLESQASKALHDNNTLKNC